MSESEGFGRLDMEGIKTVARTKLQNDPVLRKQILEEPDHLPLTSASIDRILMYWELVSAALAEE